MSGLNQVIKYYVGRREYITSPRHNRVKPKRRCELSCSWLNHVPQNVARTGVIMVMSNTVVGCRTLMS
jgi:hypothetical protein